MLVLLLFVFVLIMLMLKCTVEIFEIDLGLLGKKPFKMDG